MVSKTRGVANQPAGWAELNEASAPFRKSAIPMFTVRVRARVSMLIFRVRISGPSEWRSAVYVSGLTSLQQPD